MKPFPSVVQLHNLTGQAIGPHHRCHPLYSGVGQARDMVPATTVAGVAVHCASPHL